MTHVEQRRARPEKESIHSGHFMVSHFEAEAQDDDDLAAVPVPDEESGSEMRTVTVQTLQAPPCNTLVPAYSDLSPSSSPQQISIETSLTKLFKCMTLAYRQKLTSPKWNRFKGIKLRWKDKIRLNNVIWRCWHMQFIKRKNTLVCQFASPLDVDVHVKPETTILEGKYWKRRAEAVKAEYKKWRMFHMRRLLGRGDSSIRDMVSDMDVETFSLCGDMAGNMLMDEDYIAFMSDTLFSTITSNQPFAFPDTREIARGASLADFIQPSLGPLQPNLDDFMDTLEPLQELLSQSRLPPVPEEPPAPSDEHAMYRSDLYAYGLPPAPSTATAAAHSSAVAAAAVAALHIGSEGGGGGGGGGGRGGGGGGARMLPAPEPPAHAVAKSERAAYDAAALYAPRDPHTHTIPSAYPPPHAYDARTTHAASYDARTTHAASYGGKAIRTVYAASPKILPHPDTGYTKSYNTQVLTPSQTAPETVSLLQQGGGGGAAGGAGGGGGGGGALAGRGAYPRERPSRPRIAQYTSQLPHQAPSPHFQPYATPTQHHAHAPPQQYEPQYLSAALDGYCKPSSRSYKLPLQPINTISPQQSSAGTSRAPSLSTSQKESFRSNSLPLGVQLTADWSIAAAPPAPPAAVASIATAAADITPRAQRAGGVVRRRSRSSSGGAGPAAAAGGAGGGGGRRVPPPLASVASEPTLPQASVMLAQLLSSQHSQSMYKLNVSGEDMSTHAEQRSPRTKQPSPAQDAMPSPLLSASPGTSPPQSPSSPREPRRATHQHAEQKRRYNIKNGFDTLQALIPHLNNNPAAKVSKAAMLQKGAEYIKQLKAERNQIKDEMESLRLQIECLNNSISNCHSLLPATGAPVSRARAGRLREMFARHVAARSLHNWKYWLFSVVATALVESFSNCVSCGSGADLVRSTLLWAEQHCSLVEMRPAVLSSLRVLCTTTDILTCPERLPEEARAAATRAASIKAEPL